MTRFSAGIVLTGSDGYVHVRIWDKSHFICPEDMGMLLFVGETVPLLQKNPDPVRFSGCFRLRCPQSIGPGRYHVDWQNPIRYMLPRDRFIAVALGEDVSCILFEVPGDVPEPEIISPHKGGAAS